MSASRRSGTTDELGPDEPERSGGDGPTPPEGAETAVGPVGPDGTDLLAALLDGMDAALCAFDGDGIVTHWNREAERILGWTAAEAVGRHGFAGWAVREADAEDIEGRLMSAMHASGRQVHEFALLTKDGGRVLVRSQSAAVRGPDGKPAGLYFAFSEVHAQIDLERSIALSEALFDDASWGSSWSTPTCAPPSSTRTPPARSARAVRPHWAAPWAICSPGASRSWRTR